MTTSKRFATGSVTRALRKSHLVEAAIVEKDRFGKAIARRDGWTMYRFDDHVRIMHSEYNDGMNRQFTSDMKTTDKYDEEQQWVNDMIVVLVRAGFHVEIVTKEVRFGRFQEGKATAVDYLKVTR